MEEVPFYYDPHPAPNDESRNEDEELQLALNQAVLNLIVFVVAFILLGIVCLVMYFME